MSLKTLRSIARFLMPLIGVGGFLLYWQLHEQSYADTALSKGISSHLFRYQQPPFAGDRLDSDRPVAFSVRAFSELDQVEALTEEMSVVADADHDPVQPVKQTVLDEAEPSVVPEKVPPVSNPPPLGSTDIILQVTGTLESGDELLPSDQSLYDEHAFEGRVGQPVIVTLESNDFDTYLILVSPDQRILNENDDVSDSDSDSSFTTILPSNGTYLAIANAFDSTGRGSYTLTVRAIVSSTRTSTDKTE